MTFYVRRNNHLWLCVYKIVNRGGCYYSWVLTNSNSTVNTSEDVYILEKRWLLLFDRSFSLTNTSEMCINCKERWLLLLDIILINSNSNNKHLQNKNFVYINEREVVQNVKITCAASDIIHKCIWSIAYCMELSSSYWS